MRTSAASVHVALLRGINVSGKNKLPMGDLVSIFERVGCRDVETYIQSGNVVFRAKEATARRVPARVQRAVADEFGYQVPVVARRAVELRNAARANPFLKENLEHKSLHLAFLAHEPKAAQVATLDPNRSPPDRFVVRGRDIYLCCPKGLARSKLTNKYFDSKLETTSTLRNWNTVLRLVEMVDRASG